jgi:hypothetical protein
VHNQKSSLNPLLEVVVAARWDDRFQTLKPVTGSTAIDVIRPGARMFARVSINLPKLADLRADNTTSPPYSLRLTVDVEKPFKATDPPGGHRIFIEAGADILKLVKPGGGK